VNPYLPTSQTEQDAMLAAAGVQTPLAFYRAVPDRLRLDAFDGIPAGISEFEAKKSFERMARNNTAFDVCLRGGGAYRHFIPAAVGHMAGRAEFVTAYTPYQAEISQGILQAIFEYQTGICRLTGMDASNASLYDGATAAGEAVCMCADARRREVCVAKTTAPHVLAVLETYCRAHGLVLRMLDERAGQLNPDFELSAQTACVYVQSPNFYGIFEDIDALAEKAHAVGAKLVVGINPIALGLTEPPTQADVVCGEGQPLGIPVSFGGPYLGILACKKDMMRKLPGRIVGQTVDKDGKTAYCLTLQTREQHIRREKASSSVCSNQALCALRAGIYLASMGGTGVAEVARQCYHKAHYACEQFAKAGFARVHHAPFFHEFLTDCKTRAKAVAKTLAAHGILSGLPVGENRMLWCVTECVSREDIDRTAAILAREATVARGVQA